MWYDVGNLNVYTFRNFIDISAEIHGIRHIHLTVFRWERTAWPWPKTRPDPGGRFSWKM